jgi:transcriptional regulator with XRE-family HTH domain
MSTQSTTELTYGPALRRLREAADIPQARLAERIGIHVTILSQQETGKRPMEESDFLRAKASLVDLVDERQKEWLSAKAGMS